MTGSTGAHILSALFSALQPNFRLPVPALVGPKAFSGQLTPICSQTRQVGRDRKWTLPAAARTQRLTGAGGYIFAHSKVGKFWGWSPTLFLDFPGVLSSSFPEKSLAELESLFQNLHLGKPKLGFIVHIHTHPPTLRFIGGFKLCNTLRLYYLIWSSHQLCYCPYHSIL